MQEIVSATELAWGLSIVLALIFALRAIMRVTGLDAGPERGRAIRVIDSVALGRQKRVVLVEAGDERLLLATSESGIAVLKVLNPEVSPAGEKNADPVRDEGAPKKRSVPRFAGRWTSILTVVLVLIASSAAQAAELSAEGLSVSLGGPEGLSSSLELLALLTLISVAPSILLMATCFTRIVIVLAFVRQAIGVQHLPPNQVLVGLALFLTFFVMAPLGEQIRTDAYQPYIDGQLEASDALERGVEPVRRYLMSYTREADLALFAEIATLPGDSATDEGPALRILLPAFLVSELRTAFEIGFTIFLPFLVIDLVIASMLISMGMIVLPPIVVSLPFKLMLFVLVDGWNLVLTALVDGLK